MKKKRQKATTEPGKKEAQVGQPGLKKIPRWQIGLAVCLVIGTAVGFYLFNQENTGQSKTWPMGGVIGCQQVPSFVRALGFSNKAAFSTADRKNHGLILVEGMRMYQHPTWKLAGRLGPIVRDGKGNLFVAPAPWVDVLRNKPYEQNKIYRVDQQTQEMIQLVDLPKGALPSSQNPFGILGLSFDCDTKSFYASSVAGSTRNDINGRIFHLDQNGKILAQLEKKDAIGLAVFNSAKGKRLYFGQARASEIWSIALDDEGNFSGEARKEVSLENLGPRGDDKARRINFSQNEMTIYGIEFGYNLIAVSERQQTVYRFSYNAAKDAWVYIAEPPQIVDES